MKRLILLCLLCVSPLSAQTAWPGIGGQRENLILHDGGHTLTAVAVAEGLRLLPVELSQRQRYLIGTMGWPVLQELYDVIRYNAIEGTPFNWREPVYDLLSYQGAWAVPLAARGEWVGAGIVVAGTAGFVYWRHTNPQAYSLDWQSVRNGPAFHGLVVGGAMLLARVWTGERSAMVWGYFVLNVLLTVRELYQLNQGEGSWSDLASGWLLPLPLLVVRL